MADQSFTQAIHDRIVRWLGQEAWRVEESTPPQDTNWVLVVTDPNGYRMAVGQAVDHVDLVLLEGEAAPGPRFLQRISALDSFARDNLLGEVRMALLQMGLDYRGTDYPDLHFKLSATIYFEGALEGALAKDMFFERLNRVRRGVRMVEAVLRRRLGTLP